MWPLKWIIADPDIGQARSVTAWLDDLVVTDDSADRLSGWLAARRRRQSRAARPPVRACCPAA